MNNHKGLLTVFSLCVGVLLYRLHTTLWVLLLVAFLIWVVFLFCFGCGSFFVHTAYVDFMLDV